MVRETLQSWKTIALTGNRQGYKPARMVGQIFCSAKRIAGTDAGSSFSLDEKGPNSVSMRIGSEGQGRPSLPLFIAALALIASGVLPAMAFSAERIMTPKRAPMSIRGPMAKATVPGMNAMETDPTPEEIAAGRGMEQMLLDSMIQEMRKSMPENELMPLSHGEKIYRQMLDSEYARMLSESGQIGIAELIIAQMRGKR